MHKVKCGISGGMVIQVEKGALWVERREGGNGKKDTLPLQKERKKGGSGVNGS